MLTSCIVDSEISTGSEVNLYNYTAHNIYMAKLMRLLITNVKSKTVTDSSTVCHDIGLPTDDLCSVCIPYRNRGNI